MFMNFAVSLKSVWYRDLKGCILFQWKALKIALTLCMTSVKGPPWLENWKQRLTYQKSFTYYVQIPSLVGVFEQSVHNGPKNIFSTGHILQKKIHY